jgi:cytochrome oxidase Cu insertion factor (SCO1/SenC/PrrC family)
MLNNDKTRSTLFGVIAAYFLYLCYCLFWDRHDTNTTMTPMIRWLFLILFAVAAVWLGLYALRIWKQSESESFAEENSTEDLPGEEAEDESGEEPEDEPEQAERS